MPIAFKSAQGSNNGGGGTTLTMVIPTSSAPVLNDVMVMMVTVRGGTGTTITDPTGWTLLGTQLNSTTVLAQKIYWRIATGDETNFNITITSNKASGVIIVLDGVKTTALVAAQFGGQVNASSTTVTSPALGTWASTNGIDLFLGGTAIGSNGATVVTAPANYILDADAHSMSTGAGTGTRTGSGISYRELAGVTTVGSIAATYTTAAVNIGHHVFIFEADPPVAISRSFGVINGA
jgi:hypothetical protein